MEPTTTNSGTHHGNTRTTLSNHGANAIDHSTDIVHGRKNPVKKKENDTHGGASHKLDERTKKQLKISVAQQVDYDKQIRCMSKISHGYMDFFGFVPPSLIGGIQCITCGRKDIILKFA
jgi:hypothetical protein